LDGIYKDLWHLIEGNFPRAKNIKGTTASFITAQGNDSPDKAVGVN